jgi:hypothetical protein
MDRMLGQKILASIMKENDIPANEKQTVEMLLLADDWKTNLRNIASYLPNNTVDMILPIVNSIAPQFAPFTTMAARSVNSWLGNDI